MVILAHRLRLQSRWLGFIPVGLWQDTVWYEGVVEESCSGEPAGGSETFRGRQRDEGGREGESEKGHLLGTLY